MTDAIDLTTEQRTTLSALLRRFLPGVAVWAYGSRVKWTTRPNSDLDLVAFTVPEQRAQVADLKDALAESNLPFPVDLHVWDDVPERFREIIRKEYVVVQEAKQPEGKPVMTVESFVVHIPSTAVPLPSDWRWERLDEVCDGVFDCPHSTPVLTADGPFVVRSQDMRTGVFRIEEAGHVAEDTYQERIVRAEPRYGDLLYSREGTYFGIAAEVPARVRVCLGQRMVLLRPKASQCNHRFLRYWLNSPVMASHTHGHRDGTVAERLNLPTIRQLPVAVPPLPEQRAIAHILGTLDDKIELNRKMNETLEAMARTLFKSWFVDFDPVRAKAEGRDTGLPKHLADLFPDSFQESELGEIPKGWRARFISDLTSNIQYGFTQSASSDLIGPRFLRITDIQGGKVDWSTVPFCEVSPEEHERYRLKPGDVLVARTGASTGENIYLSYAPDAVFASYLVRFQFPDVAIARLVGAFMRTQAYFEYVAGGIGGSAQPNASAQVLAGAQLVVPTPSIARMFSDLVAPLDLSIVANTHESHTLTALRNTLLPKLISGEVRVKDAERFMERGCEPPARNHNSYMV